jgi:hypothetical protein
MTAPIQKESYAEFRLANARRYADALAKRIIMKAEDCGATFPALPAGSIVLNDPFSAPSMNVVISLFNRHDEAFVEQARKLLVDYVVDVVAAVT